MGGGENDELKALTSKIQEILISDRGVLDKANRAFVSFVEAYRNHQSPYIFRLSLLNCGLIGNGMGLLYLPKLKRITMHGMDSFVGRPDVDLNSIAYKYKKKEKERQQKLAWYQEKKLQKEKRREAILEKQKAKGTLNLNSNRNQKRNGGENAKARKRERDKKRKGQFDKNGEPKKKMKKRASHKLREFRHYQKEEMLLKQLKKNHISQDTFDKEMGYKM